MRPLSVGIAFAYFGALLSLALPVFAQDLPGTAVAATTATEPPTAAQLPILPKEIAELEIAMGRMRLLPTRFRIVRKHESFPENNGQRSVQVSAVEGRPTLRLTYADSSEKWSLQVNPIIGVRWSREFDSDPVAGAIKRIKVEYSQLPQRPIEVTISGISSQSKTRIEAQTLWHLTEQGTPEFARYVLPSLRRLNASWNLPEALAAAKRVRQYYGLVSDASLERELLQCVAELESGDYALRARAAQRIRNAGLTAQIPLEQLSRSELTAQQRSTIEQLLARLEPRTADTPTRLAYWLSGDPNWR